MQISELAEASGISIATIKFYIRSELLHKGRKISRTKAFYNQSHLNRLRLLRSLSEVAGLSMNEIRDVVDSLNGADIACCSADAEPLVNTSLAQQWAEQHGWSLSNDPHGEDELFEQFAVAWAACVDSGIPITPTDMHAYADAMTAVASTNQAAMPSDRMAAHHRTVVSMVMLQPLLASLHRLAERELARAKLPQR